MWQVLADAFRNLWLQLVKRYHPDLALSQQDKEQRHEMMIAINRAYEDTDAGTLQQIAETGKLPPPKRVQMPSGGGGFNPRRRWEYQDESRQDVKQSRLREWKRYLREVATAMEPSARFLDMVEADGSFPSSGVNRPLCVLRTNRKLMA